LEVGSQTGLEKPDVQAILAIDKSGWVDYKFKSPVDNQEHDKSSYIVRVGDFLVGVGAYKY
jgi:cytochrome c